jgi:integrase
VSRHASSEKLRPIFEPRLSWFGKPRRSFEFFEAPKHPLDQLSEACPMARPATGQLIVIRGEADTTYAARFRAYGRRHYITLGYESEGMTRAKAKLEMQAVLADVRRGIWQPPEAQPVTVALEAPPTFHEFASRWVADRKPEVAERTAESWEWALSCHLLPFFAETPVSDFTPETIDAYKREKLAERERGDGLSKRSINNTLLVLAPILDRAVEYDYVEANPVRGRLLKAERPRRTWLEPDEAGDLLRAAGKYRALIGMMLLAGLRISEATALRWRDIDLAGAKLIVPESKTDEGRDRKVELGPALLDDLKLHRANAVNGADPDSYVFPTARGTRMDRRNVARRILAPAIERANAAREKAGKEPIRERITNHSLRRTFCSLLYEAGESPASVMAQMGHKDAGLALEIYARKMDRPRETGKRVDELVFGLPVSLPKPPDNRPNPTESEDASDDAALLEVGATVPDTGLSDAA